MIVAVLGYLIMAWMMVRNRVAGLRRSDQDRDHERGRGSVYCGGNVSSERHDGGLPGQQTLEFRDRLSSICRQPFSQRSGAGSGGAPQVLAFLGRPHDRGAGPERDGGDHSDLSGRSRPESGILTGYAAKLSPQEQVTTAFGLVTLNPPLCRSSLKSSSEPLTKRALLGSITTRTSPVSTRISRLAGPSTKSHLVLQPRAAPAHHGNAQGTQFESPLFLQQTPQTIRSTGEHFDEFFVPQLDVDPWIARGDVRFGHVQFVQGCPVSSPSFSEIVIRFNLA